MGVPNKFDRLGTIAGNKLPAGYLAAEFLEFSQQINTPYKVQDYLAPKELYIDLKIWRNDPNGGMWLSLLGFNNSEQYIQRISIAGSDYNVQQHNDWACQWVAPNNRGGFKYQGQVDFTRRNKVLYKNSTVDINGAKTESPLNGTGSHVGGATVFINQPSNYATMQLYRASYAESNIKIFDYIPCITSEGQAVLYNKIDGSEVTAAYSSIGLTIEQARTLSKLPIGGGTLTVSLPWEAQWDAGVQSALDVASTNGWTIVVQYRDPEVATTNIPVSFLESTGTQYVMTDYVPTIDFGAKVIFSQEEPDTQTRAVGGVFRPYFVLPRYYSGSRIVGGWGLNGATYLTNRPYVSGKHTSSLNYKNSRLLEFDATDKHSFTAEWADGDGILSLFAYNGGNNMQFIGGMRIYDAVFTMQDSVIGHYIPVLDAQGAPCMYDRVTEQLFPNSGTGSFIAGFDTVTQALKLATLPDVTAETNAAKKSLTVSLPWEAQLASTGVPAALQVAMDRGWTITVQYREPEVATENIAVDFLESTGTQYIDSSYIPNNETGVRLDIECTIQGDYVPMGCRNSSTTETRFYALRPTPGSTHGFGWGSWFFTVHEIVGDQRMVTMLNYCNSRKVESKYVSGALGGLPFTPLYPMFIFAANIAGTPSLVYGGRIWNAAISQGGKIVQDFIPVIDSQGVPCMYDKLSKQEFCNLGTGSFIAGFETTDKAALGLSKLPIVQAGELTVSLPAAAQDDATFVPAAIEVARQRGWTIITQYRED